MSLIPFPDVPDVLGVPAIPRSPTHPPTVQAALGIVAGSIWRAFQVSRQWGIYDSKGQPLADPRRFQGLVGDLLNTLGGTTVSTGSVEYSKETKVSDFPVERGGFASYNKVETPAAPVVILCMNGSEADRSKFLAAIDKATLSTDLYDVLTPEKRYVGYSIERYNYSRRADRGATLLIVEIMLKEVRNVSASFAKSERIKDPKAFNAQPSVDSGKVQAQTPRDSVAIQVKKYLQGLVQ